MQLNHASNAHTLSHKVRFVVRGELQETSLSSDVPAPGCSSSGNTPGGKAGLGIKGVQRRDGELQLGCFTALAAVGRLLLQAPHFF